MFSHHCPNLVCNPAYIPKSHNITNTDKISTKPTTLEILAFLSKIFFLFGSKLETSSALKSKNREFGEINFSIFVATNRRIKEETGARVLHGSVIDDRDRELKSRKSWIRERELTSETMLGLIFGFCCA